MCPLIRSVKARVLRARCRISNGERRNHDRFIFFFFFFFLSFGFSYLPWRKAIRWRFSSSLWFSSTERRRLYRWVSATKENRDLSIGSSSRPWKMARNGDISLYRWLSETIYTGDCCGWGESKGKAACMSLDSSSSILIKPLICFDLLFL